MSGGVLGIFRDAGPFGWLILGILFILSVAAWAILLWKYVMLRDAEVQNREFIETLDEQNGPFWDREVPEGLVDCPLAHVYETGRSELYDHWKIAQSSTAVDDLFEPSTEVTLTAAQVSTIARVLEREINTIQLYLSDWLVVLATAATVSPLLGLLGTVFGVMIAFRAMGAAGSANIAVVGPGISEALVTTVTGLVVAVPSAVGYNYLASRLRVMRERMENFGSEFLSEIEKHLARNP